MALSALSVIISDTFSFFRALKTRIHLIYNNLQLAMSYRQYFQHFTEKWPQRPAAMDEPYCHHFQHPAEIARTITKPRKGRTLIFEPAILLLHSPPVDKTYLKKEAESWRRGSAALPGPPIDKIYLKKPAHSQRPPPPWRDEIRSVLISRARLARRVHALARQIERDFAGGDLVIVALLNGTVVFLADLLRGLTLPLRLDFIGVSSYRDGAGSGGLMFTKELRLDVRGRDVLLVDDILDTGRTLSRVLAKLRPLQPRRLKTCVLLDKPARRLETIAADYVGFTIPDEFVVGYGLDYAEKYRNLPFVGLLHPRIVAVTSGATVPGR
jgi:hypoxanthine phosphoribosyltransferase